MIRCIFAGRLLACLPLILASFALRPAHASPSPTLDAARAAHALSCGVVVEQDDFTKGDSHGDLSNFGGAICRAVAAATLGAPGQAHVIGYPDNQHGIDALETGRVALLVGTTPDPFQALLHHLSYSRDLFVDGEGFMVDRSLHIARPGQLSGRLVCYLQQTPAELAVHEWQAANHVAIYRHPFEEAGEMEAALTTGRCHAIIAAVSILADMRADFHGRKTDFAILPQLISVDPFAAATRNSDPTWTMIVNAVVGALIEAEQVGITSGNVGQREGADNDSAAARLLGQTPGYVKLLGLEDGWARRAISSGGNYGDIFDHTLGKDSPLQLVRGHSALWSKGGMIATPTIP